MDRELKAKKKPNRQAYGRTDRNPGFYWFADAWLASEVQQCSYEAQGLWINMLCHMSSTYPPGVAPGDRVAIAEMLGVQPGLRETWVDQYGGLLDELERRRVFSRGEDVDDRLDARAIVNRRIYREFIRAQSRSEHARVAATMRHAHAQTCSAGCPSDARFVLGESAQHDGDSVVASTLACPGVCSGGAQKMPFSPLLSSTKRKTAETKTEGYHTQTARARDAASAADILRRTAGLTRPAFLAQLHERIIRLTHDGPAYSAWWRNVLACLDAADLLDPLHTAIEHAEQCADPRVRAAKGLGVLAHPDRFLTSSALRTARQHRLALPHLPEKGT